jgi:competence protein ComEC
LKVFTGNPFLRILLPFVAGILLAIHLNLRPSPAWLFLPSTIIVASLLKLRQAGSSSKIFFLIGTDFFLLLFGAILPSFHGPAGDPIHYINVVDASKNVELVAVVNDIPAAKAKTIKLDLKLISVREDTKHHPANGRLYAYVQKSTRTQLLRAGDGLMISGKLQEILSPLNPGEFNYRQYLHDRGVYHTMYIDSSGFIPLAITHGMNVIWKLGISAKQYILRKLSSAGLTAEAEAICSALLTGYDAEIGDDLVSAFAHSGTLHVLSVSGLHTGLIYLVVVFFFDKLDKHRRYGKTRFFVITIVLWLFALITGFAAPVLRAVVMFNLLGIGRLFFSNRKGSQLNLLFVSAFLLLAYNPYFIRDVGFLLSYSAMIGLLVIQPPLSRLWSPPQPVVRYAWQSITASAAATLSTLPFTLYFFKQFPLWFFVCNIVVVPLTFAILLLAATLVFNTWIIPLVINWLVDFLTAFIRFFDNTSFGYVGDINFGIADAFILTLVILLTGFALASRSPKLALATVAVMAFWQLSALLEVSINRTGSLLTVYNAGRDNIIAVKDRDRLKMNSTSLRSVSYHARPHLIGLAARTTSSLPFNYVKGVKDELLVLSAPGHWPDIDPAKVTVLVLMNNFIVGNEELKRFKSLRLLVCDASNKPYSVTRLSELCRKSGLGFYYTAEAGAFTLDL